MAPFKSPGCPHLSTASAYLPSDISIVFEYLTWGTWVLNCLFLYGTKSLCSVREFLVFGRLSTATDDDVDVLNQELPPLLPEITYTEPCLSSQIKAYALYK